MTFKAIRRASPAVQVFCLAISLRLVAMVVLRTWDFDPANHHWAAGWETGRIAMNLANGRGFVLDLDGDAPTGWLAPAYPALLGGLFACFGVFSKTALVIALGLQITASAWTAVALLRLGELAGHARVGWWAGFCFACSPAAVSMSTRVLWSTSLVAMLVVVLAGRFVVAGRASSGKRSAVELGCLGGVGLLVSPVLATCLAAGCIWLWTRRRGATALLLLMIAALVVGPWLIRNRVALGRWSFVKSNFGNELFIGNHEGADGRYHQILPIAERVLPPADSAALLASDETRRVAGLGAAARRWIADHPGRFVELTFHRVVNYWRLPLISNWDALLPDRLGRLAGRVYTVGDHLLLLLALLGAWRGWHANREFRVPISFALVFPLAYYVTHSDIGRYRFPVVPLTWLLAVYGAWSIGSRFGWWTREPDVAERLPRGVGPVDQARAR